MIKVSIIALMIAVVTVNASHGQYNASDTLRAIENQFKRKKTGGIVRAVVAAGFAILIATANPDGPQPTTVTTPSAPGYTLTTTYYQENNSSKEGNIFGAVVFAGLAVSGIIQAANYSDANLNKALELYRQEKRLLRKAKFKPKDFRVSQVIDRPVYGMN